MTLDLLLINPGQPRQTYQSLASTLAAFEPPIWASLLATYARRRGCSVEIIDANAERLTAEEMGSRFADLRPAVAAIIVYGHQPSASTQNMPAASAVCTSIKQFAPHLNVILVGGHVAALPERTLREEAADFVCGSEGPQTLVELIAAVKAGAGDYRSVSGLWYWEDDAVRTNPPGPLVRNLDVEMPGMAWDLLPMDRYRAHNWHCFGGLDRTPYGALYTTLGCPYHCSFCCIQAPFKGGEKALGLREAVNSYRYWSADSVGAQIDTLVTRYGVRNIKIADEMFVLNARHVAAICDRIIERRYDLNIWAYARVDTVRDEMLEYLRAAGFRWLALGIESGNAHVRDDVDKSFGQDRIFSTIEKIRKADINVGANYIFGLPEDDLASMQETLDVALELNTEYANFYCTMAYPGSALYDTAVRNGWQLPSSWSGYSQHAVDSLPLRTRHLPAAEVLRFRDHAFQVYFTSPRYMEMVSRRFGPAALAEIQEMTSHRLVRAFA